MIAPDRIDGLPRDGDGEPVFEAPWQAQAFAMTLALHEKGLFTWPEWAEMLGDEIAHGGYGDGQEGYYLAWLAALENMVRTKGLAREAELGQRRAAWEEAARNTPHGTPVELPSER